MQTALREKRMGRTLVGNHSHWGAFTAVVEDGRVIGTAPFSLDPDPSPLIDAIPDAVYSPTRVASPMVRQGWLEGGPAHRTGSARQRPTRTSFQPNKAIEWGYFKLPTLAAKISKSWERTQRG